MKALRKKIDSIDRKILALFAQRFEAAKEIGKLKKKQGYGIPDPTREKELASLHAKLEKTYKLSKTFTKPLWDLVLAESKRIQKSTKP